MSNKQMKYVGIGLLWLTLILALYSAAQHWWLLVAINSGGVGVIAYSLWMNGFVAGVNAVLGKEVK